MGSKKNIIGTKREGLSPGKKTKTKISGQLAGYDVRFTTVLSSRLEN